jgi:hypothetical protein
MEFAALADAETYRDYTQEATTREALERADVEQLETASYK